MVAVRAAGEAAIGAGRLDRYHSAIDSPANKERVKPWHGACGSLPDNNEGEQQRACLIQRD
jgi:hypothetical protein